VRPRIDLPQPDSPRKTIDGLSILHFFTKQRTLTNSCCKGSLTIDNIILNAYLITSEAEENVDPVLLDFKNSYGSHLVVVRDMAKGIKLSVDKNFPNASQQVCQIHFLSDIEKDLITEYHKKLKNSIVKHKLTSKLKSLRYENNESGDSMIKRIQDRWIHIAVDHLLFPVEKRVKWMRCPISYFIQVLIKTKEVLIKIRTESWILEIQICLVDYGLY
jgi:hypothetical protein